MELRCQSNLGPQRRAAAPRAVVVLRRPARRALDRLADRGPRQLVVHLMLGEPVGEAGKLREGRPGDVEEVVVANEHLLGQYLPRGLHARVHLVQRPEVRRPLGGPVVPAAVALLLLEAARGADLAGAGAAEQADRLLVKHLRQAARCDEGIKVHVKDTVAVRPLFLHDVRQAQVRIPSGLAGVARDVHHVAKVPRVVRVERLALVADGLRPVELEAAVDDQEHVPEPLDGGRVLGLD
eukprot:CAMPEP_0168368508 /NCGR_PEP_ID=MMETSP0228-20121227/6286_1 /TAXON_ID=133427 /ORGANISM="Protoceratium reticulatum, Strain CCCM 535 (=CCMP 1889)" /LENGTH=237 /DNA_ID=CAMNT_0008381355 /DNA_START=191 /DNA_END=901 /DNA_ORIENTATION=-